MQKILRLPQVIEMIGMSKSSIYLAISNGNFPKPIKLSERSVGWTANDIENFIERKIQESRGNNEHI